MLLVSNIKVNFSQPLPPQLVCNQGNHSVAKTSNQFLQFKAAVFESVSVQTLGNGARISNEYINAEGYSNTTARNCFHTT